MLDYQKIVDDVRSSLYCDEPRGIDFLRGAVADYSVACDEINQRLSQCGALLRQGLRSEALQRCEMEPNLLDVVALLDLPERSQWAEILSHYGIAVPPPLLLDVAADLNNAYAIDQPLAALLRQHRLLALSRSPLKSRIGTLREIVELDGENRVWSEDLQTYERERQKQIQQEVGAAIKVGDLITVSALTGELLSDEWLEPPASSLLEWANTARSSIAKGQARVELEKLQSQMSAACANGNLDLGRLLRQHWNDLASIALPEHDSAGRAIVARAQPALEWLRQQDEMDRRRHAYEQDAAAFSDALSDGAEQGTLERLHDALLGHGFAVSPELEQRYASRIATLKRSASRRRRLIATGTIAATVLLACVAGYVIYDRAQNHAIAERTAALKTLIDESKFDDAGAYLRELETTAPRVAGSPAIQEQSARLAGVLATERSRQQSFADWISKAEESGLESPNWQALSQARQLATTDAEKGRVEQLNAKVSQFMSERQAERDGVFEQQLPAIADRVRELGRMLDGPAESLAGLRTQIRQIRADLKALEDRSSLVSQAARGQAGPLSAKLDAMSAAVDHREALLSLELAVSEAAGNSRAYRNALIAYADKFPESPRSKDFKNVVAEQPLWEGIEQWNQVATAWNQLDRAHLDPSGAKTLADTIQLNSEKYANSPLQKTVGAKLPFLRAMVSRNKDGKQFTDTLDNLCRDPLVAEMWLVTTKDGRRFYCKNAPQGEYPITFKWVSGFDLSEKSNSLPKEKIDSTRLAPQGDLAQELRRILKTVDQQNWESPFCQMARTIQQADEVDAILRLVLLQKTLKAGSQGSYSLTQAFAAHTEELEKWPAILSANWLNPDDPTIEGQRARAAEILKALPSIEKAAKAAADNLAAMRSKIDGHRWIGWLRRGPDSKWECASMVSPGQPGRLFMVWNGNSSGQPVLEEIGRATEKSYEVIATRSESLLEGRPIYFLASP